MHGVRTTVHGGGEVDRDQLCEQVITVPRVQGGVTNDPWCMGSKITLWRTAAHSGGSAESAGGAAWPRMVGNVPLLAWVQDGVEQVGALKSVTPPSRSVRPDKWATDKPDKLSRGQAS